MDQIKWLRIIFTLSACVVMAILASCGSGGGSDPSNDAGNQSKVALPDFPMEYAGEFTGTFSGSFEGDYQQEVTVLFTPRRQYYLTTLTVYFVAQRDEGEVFGLLNTDITDYEITASKDALLPGIMVVQLEAASRSVTLTSLDGDIKLVELSNDEFVADVAIILEGVTANNELIQVNLKGNISAAQHAPALHVLSDFVMTPPTPSDLLVNDIVTIDCNYSTIEPDGVHLFNFPVVQGGRYSVNASPGYVQGNGLGQVTFQVYAVSEDTASVESTTVLMVSADQQRVLAAVELPLDYTYFQ